MGKKSLVSKRMTMLKTISENSISKSTDLLISRIIWNTGDGAEDPERKVEAALAMEAMAEKLTPMIERLSEEELLEELKKLPQYPTQEQLAENGLL